MPRGPVGRLLRLPPADAALLAEAFVLLALSSAAIRLLPFRTVGRIASWGPRAARPGADESLPARVAWAVQACSRRAPWRAVCFQQGLAAQLMLRRRGAGSTLYFGAAPDATEGLAAHVWVRDGAQDVVGCEIAQDFALLAQFPPPGA